MPTARIDKLEPRRIYFCTCTVIEWIDIFTKPVYFQILADSLRYCRRHKGLLLYGYVFMTNHIHLMFSAAHPHTPDAFLRDFKKWTTRAIAQELGNESRQYIPNLLRKTIFKNKNNQIQIWQPGNYAEGVESESFLFRN
ncbi:MAG: transposase [Thermodesulfobacteriota bacterium]|nr:transposase [Thermodesulfobacteriota bacterium]